MRYTDTRNGGEIINGSKVIITPRAKNGGVFAPEDLPTFTKNEIESICDLDYPERLAYFMGIFFDDVDKDYLLRLGKIICRRFENDDPAPLVGLCEDEFILELFHGPSCTHYDVGMSIITGLVERCLENERVDKSIIFVSPNDANSCFASAKNLSLISYAGIMACYPFAKAGIVQRLALAKEENNNLKVVPLVGEACVCKKCETNVKDKLGDEYFVLDLNDGNIAFIVAHITSLFSAYADMLSGKVIKFGDKINVSVPADDLTFAVAAKYAYRMGLPIGKIVVAQLNDDFFVKFLSDGRYKVAESECKYSDNIPLGLEWLLFEINANNGKQTAECMKELKEKGETRVEGIKFITKEFYSSLLDIDESMEFTADFYDEFGYVVSLDTAHAISSAADYFDDTGDITPIIYIASTSPFLTVNETYTAVTENEPSDVFDAAVKLSDETGMDPPEPLSFLFLKQDR